MVQLDYYIVLIGLAVVLVGAFAAAFFYMRELRLRSMSPAHTQTDLTNMMILFQTMRDILSQQKDLAREFNISIDKKVNEVRKLIESSGNVRADLEQAKREISKLSTQTRKELAALERRLMQVDRKVASDTEKVASDTEKVASDTEKVVSDTETAVADTEEVLEESDDAAPDQADLGLGEVDTPPEIEEEAAEASAATQEETGTLDVFPSDVVSEEDDFLSKWAGDDFETEDEVEEDEPETDPMEDAEDAAHTRDALRDLLDLHAEARSNGGGPSSSDVLNSGGNGGRYLTPIQKRVYEYSDAGMRVPEIARELGVGKGEIRLILSLRRDRSI